MHPLLHERLPFVTVQVLLCLDPSPPWDLFSALALSLLCYLIVSSSLIFKFDAGVGYLNYAFGASIGSCVVNGPYLLLLGKPLRNFKYTGNGDGNVDKVWWKRYFDVVCIPHTPRGIGWNYQVKNIPPAPRQTRHQFILRSALRAACYMVLSETARLYVWYNPAYSSAAIGTQGYITQFINTVVWVGLTYWSLNAMYFAMAAGSVAFELYEPRMWPDLYGAWGDAYTVRRFWGRAWHQMLRSFVAPLGKATSTALGMRPGTLSSSYTQLYVAFFLSGLFHSGGDIALFSHNPTTSRPFFSMPFFLSQAFIITLEDILIGVAKRLKVKSSAWTRALGYIWVAAWFGWCVPAFVREMIRAGGEFREPGADKNAMDSNLVQVMLGLLGFDIGGFIESWFLKV